MDEDNDVEENKNGGGDTFRLGKYSLIKENPLAMDTESCPCTGDRSWSYQWVCSLVPAGEPMKCSPWNRSMYEVEPLQLVIYRGGS